MLISAQRVSQSDLSLTLQPLRSFLFKARVKVSKIDTYKVFVVRGFFELVGRDAAGGLPTLSVGLVEAAEEGVA